jgi:predicted TIM-barrel fold metal-dependent hydrolase
MTQAPKHIIDVHTHVFNARYLPIKGITSPYIGNLLASSLATIMNGITKSSFQETEEADWAVREYIRPLVDEQKAVDYAEVLWLLIEKQVSKRAVRQTKMFRSVQHEDWERKSVAELESDSFMKALGVLSTAIDKGDLVKAGSFDTTMHADIIGAIKTELPVTKSLFNVKESVLAALRSIADKLQKANAFGDSTQDYLEFLYTLTKDEKSMFEKIRREYRSDQSVHLFVHYMMDMKYGCKKPDDPYYAFFPQQCEYMMQLAASAEGALIGYSAFDPRRENWREIADKSLRMGFLGFKFYPSMGFLPIGNKDKVIESRVEDFFRYCIERNVPVVAHCTPKGFQAVKGSGIKAHPKHWADRLKQPGFGKLKLNLGHAGGGKQSNAGIKSMGWYAENQKQWDDPDNFARIVFELCTTYENVYCDVSYLLELYATGSKADSVRANFERNFLEKLNTANFSQKIMFGSDWNMAQIIDETDDYLDYYLKLFSRDEFAAFSDGFFWKNALSYLDLTTYLNRLDAIAERPEVLAYGKALRSRHEVLNS